MKAIRQRSNLCGCFMVDWWCGLTHIALPCDLRRIALQHLPLFRQPRASVITSLLSECSSTWNPCVWLLDYCAFVLRASGQMDGEGVDCDNRRVPSQRLDSVRPTRRRGGSADATTQRGTRAWQRPQIGALWRQLFERQNLCDACRVLGCQLGEQRQSGAVGG